jgi:4-diphosphocytidyl-2C-methyl-D-erythritol kinase
VKPASFLGLIYFSCLPACVPYITCKNRYRAQWDVLKQLEQKVRELLQSQRAKNTADETTKQTLLKLERDFSRVQEIAINTNSKIHKAQKQWQQRGSVAVPTSESRGSGASVFQQEQERMQAQLQQDVSCRRDETADSS